MAVIDITYCSRCGEKFYSATLAAACQHNAPEKFATVTWVAYDITSIAPSLSAAKAADWLANNENNLQSLMTERGWNAIFDLLAMDGIPTQDTLPE